MHYNKGNLKNKLRLPLLFFVKLSASTIAYNGNIEKAHFFNHHLPHKTSTSRFCSNEPQMLNGANATAAS